MTRALRAIRKALAMILPWASRTDRHAAIDAASAQKQRAFRDRDQARVIEAQINKMAGANHWAERVADGLGLTDRSGDT